MSSRIFKSLQIARCGLRQPNEFLLERLASIQLEAKHENKTTFVSGPHMEGRTSADPYGYWSIGQRIESTLLYFMRPHKIQFYGAENLEDTAIPDILFRAWLSHKNGTNRLLVFMERVDLRSQETRKYWVSVNNRSWHPETANWDWKKPVGAVSQSIEGQTVHVTKLA